MDDTEACLGLLQPKHPRDETSSPKTPLDDGPNLFDTLPDELVCIILKHLPFDRLCVVVCGCVCRRWTQLMKRYIQTTRWDMYEKKMLRPRSIKIDNTIDHVAFGTIGEVYTGKYFDHNVYVWGRNSHSYVLNLGSGVERLAASPNTDEVFVAVLLNDTIEVWKDKKRVSHRSYRMGSFCTKRLLMGRNHMIYASGPKGVIKVWPDNLEGRSQILRGHTNTKVCSF